MAKMNFDEAAHEYTLNGVTYTSTTQLMKKYGLTADYGGIPQDVLDKAAKMGSAVHKGLEMYIKGQHNAVSLYNEVALFDNWCKLQNLDPANMKSEEIVYDTNYEIAGTLDLQYEQDQDDIIADFKRTSTLHIDAVAWQLSIYNYLRNKGDMMKYYFTKLKVFHFSSGRLYVKDVYTVDYDSVVALLETHKRRDPVFNYVKPNKVILPTEETYLVQIMNEISQYTSHIDKLVEERDKILGTVKANFVKQKDYSYENKSVGLVIKYKMPVTRRNFNQKKAKEFIESHGGNLDTFYNETVSGDGISAKIKPVAGVGGDSGDES